MFYFNKTSPEKKVKGHSGTIYRVPIMMLYTKYESSVVSDKKIFESCIFKTCFWPRDLLMQPIRPIWTILVEDYPGTIPVEFGQIPISSSR